VLLGRVHRLMLGGWRNLTSAAAMATNAMPMVIAACVAVVLSCVGEQCDPDLALSAELRANCHSRRAVLCAPHR